MHINFKFNVKSFFALTASAILLVVTAESKNTRQSFHTSLPVVKDTIIPSKKDHFSVAEKQILLKDSARNKTVSTNDTIPVKLSDSIRISSDSTLAKPDSSSVKSADTLHIKLAKNALEAPVTYSAEDSMVLNVPAKTVTLYGKKATTHYKDNDLTAPVIAFDQETGDITAAIRRDSTGKVIALPTFKQSDFTSQSDSIRFNMKSGKGLTKSTYTQQGEMYVYGDVIKKVDNNVFYALRGRFTTCNLDTPHFAFISNKIKFITNKLAITGPVHPEFEGIPIPVYLPFGIFPLNQERHSGFLAPNFTANEQRGLGLEGLGYYKVINEHWDVIFRSSIYSYGGWSLNVNPRYSKRYHYSGNLSFDIQQFNLNFKGDPDFSKNRSYHIMWSHSADTKSRPGVTFSASVNAGSSSYNASVPNNPQVNFTNQMYSSIAYSKSWKDKPFNLTLTANHDQNTNLHLINISLPSVGFNVNTVYPFRKKESVGDLKWYENIGIAYVGTALNKFSFYDDPAHQKPIFQQIADTLQWGAHHSVPITLSLPQIGVFQLAPSVTYDETWYQKKVTHTWDNNKDTLLTSVQNGFFTARQMSFGLNLSTRIFGMIVAKNKNAKIQAIRHEIRPTFGINYQPDFNKQNYYYAQVDTSRRKQLFPYFESGSNLYGPYTSGTFGGFNFGIENNISAKVRDKKDTTEGALKKISLLDAFSVRGSYNFFRDSLRFDFINASASTNLFNKLNVTASAVFDPYEVNSSGIRINTLVWKKHPISLGRMTSANISLSSQFQGGNKKTGEKGGLKPNQMPLNSGYTQDEYNNEMAYINNDAAEFADFNIPWSVNFSYSMSYSKTFVAKSGFQKIISQNVNFGGTVNLTPKWQMGINGYYNISLGQLNPLSLSISRDLHCWQMSINMSPLGLNRYFSINISPKSPLLRDLKINRTRSYYTGL